MKSKLFKVGVGICLAAVYSLSQAIESNMFEQINLRTEASINYEGAFRLLKGTFGDSRTAYTGGKIAINTSNKSFYLSGGTNKKSIAEFPLPQAISKDLDIAKLPMVSSPLQDYHNILDRAETGNPTDVGMITGLYYDQGKLVVNSAVYYDASGSNKNTTLIIETPGDLASSKVRGYMKLEAAHHASGWISKVPYAHQSMLGQDLISGYASNISINLRSSMGPSAFLINSSELFASTSGEIIETESLIDFSIDNLLAEDPRNSTLNNDLWTEVSMAEYSFIIPSTNTYMTLGASGGHDSGIGYKISQENGNTCSGWCPYDYRDYYSYFWLWDVKDMLDTKSGLQQPYEVRPYLWGKINMPFQERSDGSYNTIIGATYTESGLYTNYGELYVLIGKADTLQSDFNSLPVVLVFSVNTKAPRPPKNLSISIN